MLIAFSMLSQRSVVSGVSSSSSAWFAFFLSGNFVSSSSDTAAKIVYGKIYQPSAMDLENVDDSFYFWLGRADFTWNPNSILDLNDVKSIT